VDLPPTQSRKVRRQLVALALSYIAEGMVVTMGTMEVYTEESHGGG
jgi:hypothetical protein